MNKVLLVIVSAAYITALSACADYNNLEEVKTDNIAIEFDSSDVKTYKTEW